MLSKKNTIFLFLIISTVLLSVSYLRFQDFKQNSRLVAEQSVKSGASEIARVISEFRRRIVLFAEEHRSLLLALVDVPTDDKRYQQLTQLLQKNFPNVFAATLAKSNGIAILNGLDSLVGNGCRRDIRSFVGSLEGHGVYVHGSPKNNPHHFDIMVPFIFPSGEEGVFFVSFYAKQLALILRSIEVTGHNLYLTITKDVDGVVSENNAKISKSYIEVSSEGARDEIVREMLLTPEENASVLASAIPEGTRWLLVDVPDESLIADKIKQIFFETILIEFVFLGLLFLVFRLSGKVVNIEKQHEAAEEANRIKSEFLSVISHELRTPLNAIIGMSELIQDTKLDQEQGQYLDLLIQSEEHLLKLINDILDYTNIDANKFSLKESAFRFDDIITGYYQFMQTKADEKGIKLTVKKASSIPELLISDEKRLLQALQKIGDNAIKFTDENGQIDLTVEMKSEDENEVLLCFSIKDNGIGIKADYLDKLFHTFSQLDGSTTRQYGGMGIGLKLSQKLIQKMGGEIWVESEIGKGSTFFFTIKLLKLVSNEGD